ncbi:penicillin-binding transpeptidase domain-containing protein [Saccharibacillus sp. CPCC 101409]|uniref:peptidoglycan D,D-transpeptidase FtsI family protein n=1 Tax=Saccharibacillus sp. CPCC 101409 TaxID=3058041 RepID=UPI0026740887|nr:penicillin-binding transpeptidase domain-containing protein [Saccharibacillus sp. CPCC 101409]MDO3410999.1 penicillin-binding transpeptidase domain-containing protein [Saccharibacillus sp. CPCC 101409]
MKVQDKDRENESRRQRSFGLRLNLFFFSVFVIFSVIIVRTAMLQFVEGPELKEQAVNQATRDIPMAPVRGTIYSADKVPIAYSEPTQTLYATPLKTYGDDSELGLKNRPELKKAVNQLLAKFQELNPGGEPITLEEMLSKERLDLNNKSHYGYTPRKIKTDLNEAEVAYFKEHKNEFKGVLMLDVVEETTRAYDPDSVAVQTVGYLSKFKSVRENPNFEFYQKVYKQQTAQSKPNLQYLEDEIVGYYGLEQEYQEELRGKNGYKRIEITPQSMAKEGGTEEVVAPQKGNDIWMSINKYVQTETEKAISEEIQTLRSTHPYVSTGFAVAMDVENGNVVAMASMPDFDANYYSTGSISGEHYEEIKNLYVNGTIRAKAPDDLRNKAESVVYMGSTIKPLSVLIGLKEGLFGLYTPYYDDGITYLTPTDKRGIKNAGGHFLGNITPRTAIQESSNTFMIDMVGKPLLNKYGSGVLDIWDKHMKEFGLGVLTEVDLPGEQSGTRDYTNKKESLLSRMAYASFGQQGKYTTMQLAQYVTMLANRGERLKPHIVSKITDSNGKVVKEAKREVINKAEYSDEYWDLIQKGMNTKLEGTFDDFPYDFARKTGTSTQRVRETDIDNGVFIAYAPRENPKLAVAVVVPEGGFGSQSAAPIARKIFDAYDYEYGLDGVPKKTLEQTNEDGTPVDGASADGTNAAVEGQNP